MCGKRIVVKIFFFNVRRYISAVLYIAKGRKEISRRASKVTEHSTDCTNYM